MQKKKITIVVIIFALIVLALFGCYRAFGIYYPRIMDAVTTNVTASIINEEEKRAKVNHYYFDYSWLNNNKLIMHAFGGVDDETYTNSLEAFKHNYELGNRVFEVDFYLTNDYKTVCFHNERDWREKCNIKDDVDFTYQNFKNSKIYNKYTTLDYMDLIDLMDEYKDIYIVTDTKYKDEEHLNIQFAQIVKYANEKNPETLNRIIPQIYNEKMLDYVMEIYDFKSLIYTLYQNPDWTPERVALFCRKSGIKMITMWDSWYSKEVIELLRDFDVNVAIHTVNDIDICKKFFECGGKSIYTDFIKPIDLQEKEEINEEN